MTYPKYFAELLGTAILVIVGCGSVVVADFGTSGAVGVLAISLSFGLIVMALAYALGPVSGCHLNPAVTLSLLVAGRISIGEVPGYLISQLLGAVIGAGLLVLLLSGRLKGYDLTSAGLGQNGWGEGYRGEYSLIAALTAEIVGTFVLCLVVLATTHDGTSTPFAGIAIGATIAVLLLTFINVSGASLNPARSVGPAIFVGGRAMQQLWLFLIGPIGGGLLAGLTARVGSNVLRSVGGSRA